MSEKDTAVVEKQTEEFNPEVDEFVFEAELEGAEPARSGPFKSYKPGIDLHFYRYGLFPNADKDNSEKQHLFFDQNGEIDEQPDVLQPDGAPEVEGFFYGRTALSNGYLYLIDASNTSDFWEYKLDELGSVFPVIWQSMNADIRESTSKPIKKITFKQDTELWVAYSPVQWSSSYHELMRSNEGRRSERMIKIKCTGFKEGEEGMPDVLPFNKMFTTYNPLEKYQGIWFNDKIKESIADFNADQEKDPEAIKEDMHITLHDPMGCAVDIFSHLAYKNLELKSLVDAIQTGETIDEAMTRIADKNQYYAREFNAEHFALFTLANTCYKLVFGNPDNIKKYDGRLPEYNMDGSRYVHPDYRPNYNPYMPGPGTGPNDGFKAGVDKTKLEGILGVAERKVIREQILILRNALGTFLMHKYWQTFLEDSIHNCEDHTASAHRLILNILLELYATPYEIERALLLASEYVKDDDWQNWVINEITKVDKFLKPDTPTKELPTSHKAVEEVKCKTQNFTSVTPLTAILATGYNVDKVFSSPAALGNKFMGIIKADLTIRDKRIIKTRMSNGRQVRDITQIQTFAIEEIGGRYYNKCKSRFKVDTKKITMALADEGLEINLNKIKLKNAGKKMLINLKEEGVKIRNNNGKTTIDIPARSTQNISLTDSQIRINNIDRKVAKVVNSMEFNGAVGLMSVYNLWETGSGLKSFEEDYGKSGISLLGASADVIESGISVYGALPSVSIAPNSVLGYTRAGAGIVGGAATTAVSFWDAADAFGVRDSDAGMAYIGAGIAYGASTACILAGSAFGPIGLAAALIGLGFYVLAGLLTDNELEAFFKHFLLSDLKNFPKNANETPMAYAQRIINKSKDLVDEDVLEEDPELADPYGALVRLFDMLICTQITCRPFEDTQQYKTVEVGVYNGSTSFGGPIYDTQIVNIYYKYTMRATFMGFINSMSILNYKAYLYPNGIFHKTAKADMQPIPQTSNYYNIIPMEHGYQQAVMNLTIPANLREHVKSNSQLLFVLHVEPSNANPMQYPLPVEDERRGLGILLNMSELTYADDKQDKRVKIKPLNELLKPETWRK